MEKETSQALAKVGIEDLERALASCTSVDEVLDYCTTIHGIEKKLKKDYTRAKVRGEVALAKRLFTDLCLMAENLLKGYRLVGWQWLDSVEKGERDPTGREAGILGKESGVLGAKYGKLGGRPRNDGTKREIKEEVECDDAEETPPSRHSGRGGFPTAKDLGFRSSNRLQEFGEVSNHPKGGYVSDDELAEWSAKRQEREEIPNLKGLLKLVKDKKREKEKRRLELEAACAMERSGIEGHIVNDLAAVAGKVRTFYIDPPWHYDMKHVGGSAAEHYATLPIDDLIDQYGDAIAEAAHPEGAHMWLWTTWPMIRENAPQDFLAACGFEWKSELVWNKVSPGRGHWMLIQTEILIFAKKGDLKRQCQLFPGYLEEKKSGHSAKPEIMYEKIESFSPGPYLEIFARAVDEPRVGWWYHGHEAAKKDEGDDGSEQ